MSVGLPSANYNWVICFTPKDIKFGRLKHINIWVIAIAGQNGQGRYQYQTKQFLKEKLDLLYNGGICVLQTIFF